jgi:tRNA/rRNA methyltransferase
VHDLAVTPPFAVVLVRPSRPANVGAAARALKNFGFSDLRLVGGEEALPGGEGYGEARALAWNASDLLESAGRFESLEAAVADHHLVAATTARTEAGGELVSPKAFAEEAGALPEGLRSGCVFGPEKHGLSNEELDLCRLRLRIPTRGAQPSMNLAQSVVVTCYEMSLRDTPPEAGEGDSPPASEGMMQRLADVSQDLGLRAGYFNPQGPAPVLGELRRLIARARPTEREVTLLLGLVAQLDWARRNEPSEP